MSEIKTQTAQQPINLTEGAVKELMNIRQSENIPADYGLRIGVKGGGCSGYSYILGFDDKKEADQEYEIQGLKVLIDKTHAIYLLGIEIDFEQDLNNRGFSFNNPNADDTCGCGTSFSA
ncbi:iron-sulfur cluster assembly accessory protein [Membranicola marinus]|uniref:Iron-sulfur cluster assembly accessory protein n=1 Tax=Membranihabitans marinus TaxID=1227546 RepID=A0A953HMQ3_9BACT|nr:iron-sulfur cluster assembly accessory protein [Membranihabitans marinus]MBY5957934.1 iron-sulfur cluster assembly accessory protein [Membranihabitans marinus]